MLVFSVNGPATAPASIVPVADPFNLASPMRLKFVATMLDIERLRTTRFEPFVADCQSIDWSADRPDIAPVVADGYACDAERIRSLPEAPRVTIGPSDDR